MNWGNFYAIMGAALAVIVSGIGSAIGVGRAGQASSALLSKQPEKFGSAAVVELAVELQELQSCVVNVRA